MVMVLLVMMLLKMVLLLTMLSVMRCSDRADQSGVFELLVDKVNVMLS